LWTAAIKPSSRKPSAESCRHEEDCWCSSPDPRRD
jgi:hypothetical protein